MRFSKIIFKMKYFKRTHLLPKCGMAAFKTASIIPKRLFFAKSFHISIRSSDFSYCREMHIINSSNNVTQIEAINVEIYFFHIVANPLAIKTILN